MPKQATRSGFTLIEVLVVIAVIGLLVAMILPAVQSSREAARSAQCKNNLKQIAMATNLFHDANQAYPPARYQPRPGGPPQLSCGGAETTWLVRIMPFLEQTKTERKWDYSQPYVDHAQEIRESTLSVYCCPSRRSVSEAVGEGVLAVTTTTNVTLPCGCRVPMNTSSSVLVRGAVGDYGGNHGDLSRGSFGLPTDFYYGGNGTGVIISSRAICDNGKPRHWIDKVAHKSIKDGVSYTFLTGEMHVPIDNLGQSPEDAFIFNGDYVFNSCRVGGPTVPIVSNMSATTGNTLVAWGSWHPDACHFALCDGSVRAINPALDTELLGHLCNRKDGQVALLP